ncbi:MAG: Na+/H+ antiporter NhaA [Caulobacteraceae bacterium]
MARRPTLDFLRTEAGSGVLLAAVALAAVIIANSPLSERYFAFAAMEIPVRIGGFAHTLSVAHWIEDGLMAIFFFVVGMEIKYEVRRGELSNPRRLALPVLAALGGMAVPAAIFMALNLGPDGAPRGWAIPVATDIAFALAALAVAAPRLPPPLRIFLLTLAIVDDLGAVAIIALAYTEEVRWTALAGALAVLAVLALMGAWRRAPFLFYGVGFALVWGFTLQSGINTSLAGVACALAIPTGSRRPEQDSVLKYFMDSLHPYVAYAILPLFAFVAAGFSFADLSPRQITSPLPLGIVLALVIGKPLGVFGFSALAVGLKLGRRPTGVTWLEMFGASVLCGVGFTMSLFIGSLAFGPDAGAIEAQVRLGVVTGSILAALIGGVILNRAQKRRPAADLA